MLVLVKNVHTQEIHIYGVVSTLSFAEIQSQQQNTHTHTSYFHLTQNHLNFIQLNNSQKVFFTQSNDTPYESDYEEDSENQHAK